MIYRSRNVNAREAALKIVYDTEEKGAYSTLL